MQDAEVRRDALRGAAASVALPADRLRPVVQLGTAVTSSTALAGTGVRLPLAALAALIYRYTGETELLLGWQQGRASDEVVPVRITVEPGAEATAFVVAVADAVEAASPVGVRELEAIRGSEAAPCHAVVVTGTTDPPERTCSELALLVDDGIAVLAASGERYRQSTVDQLARHLAALAAGLAASSATIDELPMLDAEEIRTALVTWNATDDPPPPGYLHELVSAVAQRNPDATAVVREGQRITYGELDADADRLAGHLASLGATNGRVGVCLERSIESLLAQLAAFKIGAAAVLMDPEYPPQRLAFMAEHAGCAAIVTRSGLTELLPDVGSPVVRVDDDAWRRSDPIASLTPVTDETVCHIAYTSGSTGVPKAVMLRHGPQRHLVHSLIRQCGITAGANGSWLSSPGFGLVEVDCMPLLAAGATVHIPPQAVAASPPDLRDWLVAERISHALLMTAIAERLWRLEWPSDASLAVMRVAGERMRAWPPADLPYQVLNVYGSAEATVVATAEMVAIGRQLSADGLDRMPPIGRPVPNVRMYVLDRLRRPAPPGAVGELHVTGASLSAGYLGRDDATAEKFLPNTIPGDPYPVLYRTGDVARYWPDGIVEIVGRADNEVKIRGYRVHLGEIETVLAALPGVRDAAVVAREDVIGERRLVGYVTPDPSTAVGVRDLRRALAERLPAYMVPSSFLLAADLPLTPNGKIDRANLPEPPRSRPDLDAPYRAPSSELELALSGLWAKVLDLDEVGIDDSFFELGGDSLRAMRLLEAVRTELGAELRLSDLYQAPTVALAVPVVQAADKAGDGTGLPVVIADPESRYAPFPLTENQQALWIGRGDAVDYGNVGAHGYFEWERGGLDVDRFRAAWSALLRRHDMLRTVIRPDGTQVVLRQTPTDGITVTDLSALTDAEAMERADAIRAEMGHQVIPADRWPLFDVRLTVLPGGRTRMHFGLDMLIMDAWSAFQVLFPELIELYEDPSAQLPDVPVSFRDYVMTAERVRQTDAYRICRDYWLDRLDTLPAAPDLPMRANVTEPLVFDRCEGSMAPQTWQRLRERARRTGITQNGVLVAAFAEVLRSWSANERFTINFPIFDRLPLHPDIDRVLGDFTNTVLVAVDKTDGVFADRAQDLQRQLWLDLEHRYFNGVDVLRELARRTGGALRPAMPIVVTSLLGHPPRRQVSGLGQETYGISQTPQVLLDFQIREIDGVLHWKWDFLPAVFPPGLVEAMFDAYCALLEDLADSDEAWGVERFDLVPADQRAERERRNDTAVAVPEMLLQDFLAQQAAARPDAIAVIDSRQRITYNELYAQANRIGRRLRADGVRPGNLVAIVMEKGCDQYAAVYGTLIAGGAYLPVDVTVPTARLHHLLAAGEVSTVLTQSWLLDKIDWPDGVQLIAVDAGMEEDASPLPSVQSPEDLAYVIYTSGSTGEPKGVMVEQRSVVNHVLDVNGRFGIGPQDRALCTAGLHFDMSVYDVFGLVAAGATAVLPPAPPQPDPAIWCDLVRREQVTFWACVPSLLEMAVEWARSNGGRLDSLRRVVLAGDWIALTLPSRLRELAPSVAVTSCGGPTETVNWSIAYEIGEVDPSWASIPYGVPMANQRYHIVGPDRRDRPVWTPGEMFVSSEIGQARGYWRDSVRTAQRFVTLPTGQRAYATGDLGRYLPDGTIEILGRLDFQVKIGGHRIELGEIEATLVRHPRVHSAAVVAPVDGGRRRLVAYAAGDGIAPADLIAYLRDNLPAYLVPADVRIVDQLPLSTNGKVDRLALEVLADVRPDSGEPAAASGPLEQIVGDQFALALGCDSVGRNDNFFQLGGDSLTGTRLAARLSETFGVSVPLRLVFTRPTVAALSEALAADPLLGPSVTELVTAFTELGQEELDSLLDTTALPNPTA